ncbi:hypothetical protein Sjap_025370 [Stephania japonica]|uniref:Uncharacterized protein n=1 Tax=Stephania japonica TaxID=461633 RepID=A0AAP0HFI1_9MAGN
MDQIGIRRHEPKVVNTLESPTDRALRLTPWGFSPHATRAESLSAPRREGAVGYKNPTALPTYAWGRVDLPYAVETPLRAYKQFLRQVSISMIGHTSKGRRSADSLILGTGKLDNHACRKHLDEVIGHHFIVSHLEWSDWNRPNAHQHL